MYTANITLVGIIFKKGVYKTVYAWLVAHIPLSSDKLYILGIPLAYSDMISVPFCRDQLV